MFCFSRCVKSRRRGAAVEAASHSVLYDLYALYVLCDPVSLSLYSLTYRVTAWL